MGIGIKIPRNALAKGREEFRKGDSGGNVELAPGTYLAAVVGLKGVETSKGPQLVMDCLVGGDEVPDEQKGGRIALWYSFEESRVVYLFRDLSKLGYDVAELDEKTLEEIAEDLAENTPVVRIRATQSGDYTNIRFRGLMESLSVEDLDIPEDKLPAVPKKSKKSAEEEVEEEEEEDEVEEEEGVIDAKALKKMSRSELKALIKENDLDIKVLKSMSDQDLRDAILEIAEE